MQKNKSAIELALGAGIAAIILASIVSTTTLLTARSPTATTILPLAQGQGEPTITKTAFQTPAITTDNSTIVNNTPSSTAQPNAVNATSSGSKTQAGSILKLSLTSIPVNIPLSKGFYEGKEVYFITTDSSDNETAQLLTKVTGFNVNYASLLSKAPGEAVAHFYVFKNGIKGSGPFGFQPNVADSQPGEDNYSPLWKLNVVQWKDGTTPMELRSEGDVVKAQSEGKITITPTNIIVNCPFIKWDGGSLKIREDKNNITDDSPYVGGQVLNIDTDKMVVTMVAHRGWGPDGRTIYYIVADATPEMPAKMMGVSFVKKDEKLVGTPVAVDLFQFMNGIKGSGPMGFQAGIGGANPTDSTKYSPMWKISFIDWKDPSQARILENLGDINSMVSRGLITITPAMNGKHVVNCPFFTQDTIFEHATNKSSVSTTNNQSSGNSSIMTNTTTSTSTGSEQGSTTTKVSIVQGAASKTTDAFSPNPIRVRVGDTVTWTNNDSQPHTVTPGSVGKPDGKFDSSPGLTTLLSSEQTFSHKFDAAGDYPYFCQLHPNMVGTISVS